MKKKLKSKLIEAVDENGFMIATTEKNKVSRENAFDYWNAKRTKLAQSTAKLKKIKQKDEVKSFLNELESL